MTSPEGQASEETTEGVGADTATNTATDNSNSNSDEKKETKRSGNTNDSITASLDDIDDVDTLKNMVRTLRAENGNARRKAKAENEENQALKAWKLDHLRGVADAEERVAKADQVAKRYVIQAAAKEFEVDEDLVDLITGETEEEIWEKAEKLGNTKKKGSDARNPLDPGWVPGPTQLMAGKRGNPISSSKKDAPSQDTNWLRDAWNR